MYSMHIQPLNIAAKKNGVRTDIDLKYLMVKVREIFYWNRGNENEVQIAPVTVCN
jgi:hypothetical protein